MPLHAVFFDLDGTLLDTALDLSAALKRTMVEDGLNALPFEQTRPIVSDGSFALIKKGYELQDGDARINPLRQRLLDHYLQHIADETTAFPGVHSLIQNLADNNLPWGIVTNKPWAYTEPLMKHFSFASEPVCVLCPDHVTHRKPHPESLFLACQAASCLPEEALYIGDHLRDIQCGKNAGMKTIAAKYGFINASEDTASWAADYYVDNVEEIWPILQTQL